MTSSTGGQWPKHAWAEASRALRKDVPRQQYILYLKNSRTFELIEEYFSGEGMEIESVIEMGSMSAIRELVKLGLGITILPPWVAGTDVTKRRLRVVSLGRCKLKRQWGLLHWKGRPTGWAEDTFRQLCRAGASQFAARNGLRSQV